MEAPPLLEKLSGDSLWLSRSVRLSHSTAMLRTAPLAVLGSTQLVPLTATGPHRVWASVKLSHSMPTAHSALLAVPASTPLVPLTATGPHRAWASVTLMLLVWAPVVSSARPVPTLLSAFITMALVPLPIQLASVMLMPMPCMLPQSWPRDTQAGPELLPLDSSPPATDADLASVRLLKSPRMPLPPTPTEALPLLEKPSGDSLWPKLSRSVRPTPCLAVPAFTQLVLPTPTGHPRVPTAQLPTTGDKGLYP